MPAVIKVIDNRTIIQVGENSVAAARDAALAKTERQLAEAAAAFAEAFSGPVYADVTDGEAATTEDQIFRVSNGDGPPETTTAYRRTAVGSVELDPLATTSALASTDPGKGAELVGYAEPAVGAVPEYTTGILRRLAISPKSFGCVGDGITDDTINLREAVDAAVLLGRTLDVSNATYLVSKQDDEPDSSTIIPVNGTKFALVGDRSENIKIADNCGNYRAIFGPTSVFDIENWRFERVGFNKNSVSNEIESGITAQGRYSVTTYAGGSVTGKVVVTECDFILSDAVVDVYIPEVSTGSVAVERPTNRYVAVTNSRWVSCRVGGPTAVFYDQSLINIAGDSAMVTGNDFDGESWERCPATAIETHSDYTTISQNTGRRVCTAINATIGARHSAPFSRSVSVFENQFEVCRVGIYLWAERMPTTPEDGRIAGSGLFVDKNVIYHRWPKYPYVPTPRLNGIAFFIPGDPRGLNVNDVSIGGNTVIYDDPEGTDAFDRPDNVGTDAAIGFYAGSKQDWTVRGLSVTDNVVKNAPCGAYKFEYGKTKDFVLTGNSAIDCARTDSESVSAANRSIYILSCEFLNAPVIENNKASVSSDLTTKPANFFYVRDRATVPALFEIRGNNLDDVSAFVKYFEGFTGVAVRIEGGIIPSPASPISSHPVVGSHLKCMDASQAQGIFKPEAGFWAYEAWLNAVPTEGAWNSRSLVHNVTPSELGTVGAKYTIEGWRCTVGGEPGGWVQMRSLTGN